VVTQILVMCVKYGLEHERFSVRESNTTIWFVILILLCLTPLHWTFHVTHTTGMPQLKIMVWNLWISCFLCYSVQTVMEMVFCYFIF